MESEDQLSSPMPNYGRSDAMVGLSHHSKHPDQNHREDARRFKQFNDARKSLGPSEPMRKHTSQEAEEQTRASKNEAVKTSSQVTEKKQVNMQAEIRRPKGNDPVQPLQRHREDGVDVRWPEAAEVKAEALKRQLQTARSELQEQRNQMQERLVAAVGIAEAAEAQLAETRTQLGNVWGEHRQLFGMLKSAQVERNKALALSEQLANLLQGKKVEIEQSQEQKKQLKTMLWAAEAENKQLCEEKKQLVTMLKAAEAQTKHNQLMANKVSIAETERDQARDREAATLAKVGHCSSETNIQLEALKQKLTAAEAKAQFNEAKAQTERKHSTKTMEEMNHVRKALAEFQSHAKALEAKYEVEKRENAQAKGELICLKEELHKARAQVIKDKERHLQIESEHSKQHKKDTTLLRKRLNETEEKLNGMKQNQEWIFAAFSRFGTKVADDVEARRKTSNEMLNRSQSETNDVEATDLRLAKAILLQYEEEKKLKDTAAKAHTEMQRLTKELKDAQKAAEEKDKAAEEKENRYEAEKKLNDQAKKKELDSLKHELEEARSHLKDLNFELLRNPTPSEHEAALGKQYFANIKHSLISSHTKTTKAKKQCSNLVECTNMDVGTDFLYSQDSREKMAILLPFEHGVNEEEAKDQQFSNMKRQLHTLLIQIDDYSSQLDFLTDKLHATEIELVQARKLKIDAVSRAEKAEESAKLAKITLEHNKKETIDLRALQKTTTTNTLDPPATDKETEKQGGAAAGGARQQAKEEARLARVGAAAARRTVEAAAQKAKALESELEKVRESAFQMKGEMEAARAAAATAEAAAAITRARLGSETLAAASWLSDLTGAVKKKGDSIITHKLTAWDQSLRGDQFGAGGEQGMSMGQAVVFLKAGISSIIDPLIGALPELINEARDGKEEKYPNAKHDTLLKEADKKVKTQSKLLNRFREKIKEYRETVKSQTNIASEKDIMMKKLQEKIRSLEKGNALVENLLSSAMKEIARVEQTNKNMKEENDTVKNKAKKIELELNKARLEVLQRTQEAQIKLGELEEKIHFQDHNAKRLEKKLSNAKSWGKLKSQVIKDFLTAGTHDQSTAITSSTAVNASCHLEEKKKERDHEIVVAGKTAEAACFGINRKRKLPCDLAGDQRSGPSSSMTVDMQSPSHVFVGTSGTDAPVAVSKLGSECGREQDKPRQKDPSEPNVQVGGAAYGAEGVSMKISGSNTVEYECSVKERLLRVTHNPEEQFQEVAAPTEALKLDKNKTLDNTRLSVANYKKRLEEKVQKSAHLKEEGSHMANLILLKIAKKMQQPFPISKGNLGNEEGNFVTGPVSAHKEKEILGVDAVLASKDSAHWDETKPQQTSSLVSLLQKKISNLASDLLRARYDLESVQTQCAELNARVDRRGRALKRAREDTIEKMAESERWRCKFLRQRARRRAADEAGATRRRKLQHEEPINSQTEATQEETTERTNVLEAKLQQEDEAAESDTALCSAEEIKSFEGKWALKNCLSFNLVRAWNEAENYRTTFAKLRREGLVPDLATIEAGAPKSFAVRRSDVVNGVFNSSIFKSHSRKKDNFACAFQKLEIEFLSSVEEGSRQQREDGIDRSGLTNELNTLFWEQLETFSVDIEDPQNSSGNHCFRLFDRDSEHSAILLPSRHCNDSDSGQPHQLPKALEQKYEIVGRFMLRSFIHDLAVPSSFASNILVDYILNFDLRYANKTAQEMISDLLAIDPPNYQWVKRMIEDGKSTCSELLQNEDKTPLRGEAARGALKKFIKVHVIDPRELQFKAISRGFYLNNSLNVGPLLEMCRSPKELRLLLSGEETFGAARLMEVIHFRGFEDKPAQKGFFFDVLRDMCDRERRLFLRFATGLPALPALVEPSGEVYLTVRAEKTAAAAAAVPPAPATAAAADSGGGVAAAAAGGRGAAAAVRRYPRAQTCSRELILPEYSSKREMEERILEAIQPENSRFMLA